MEEALRAGLLGAIAGGVGFGLAFAMRGTIARAWSHPLWQKHGHVAVGVVLFLLAGALLRSMFPGGADEEKAMRELRTVPLVAAIIQADPDAETEVRAIVREGLASKDQSAITRRFAEFTKTRVPRYFKGASDGSTIAFTRAIVPLFKDMESNDPNTCKRGIVTGDIGIGVAQRAGDERMKLLADAMTAIVQSAATRPQAAPDPARAGAILDQVMAKLYGGNDAKLLPIETFASAPSLQRAPADRLCYTGRRIYETILTLPAADASVALRFMLSGG